jgi:uncharacterized membrane protein
VEGGATGAALPRIDDWFSGGVVVVAELFLAKAWAGAAVAVGENVAALVLFGVWCSVWHVYGVPVPVKCAQSLQTKRPASGLPGAGLWVKCEGPAFGRAAFFYLFLF